MAGISCLAIFHVSCSKRLTFPKLFMLKFEFSPDNAGYWSPWEPLGGPGEVNNATSKFFKRMTRISSLAIISGEGHGNERVWQWKF